MELDQIVEAHLVNHGVDAGIAKLVKAWESPCDPGEEPRINVTIGYQDGDVRRETAASSLPDLADAKRSLADRSWVATFLSLGIKAMPASHRPPAPDWILEDEGAERVRRSLARARDLASEALQGESPRRDQHIEDAPF